MVFMIITVKAHFSANLINYYSIYNLCHPEFKQTPNSESLSSMILESKIFIYKKSSTQTITNINKYDFQKEKISVTKKMKKIMLEGLASFQINKQS